MMAPSILASSDSRCGVYSASRRKPPVQIESTAGSSPTTISAPCFGLEDAVEAFSQRGARRDQGQRVVQRLAAAGTVDHSGIVPGAARRSGRSKRRDQRFGEGTHAVDRHVRAGRRWPRRPRSTTGPARARTRRATPRPGAGRPPGTVRTSPASPSSPKATRSGGTGVPLTTDAMASATARSAAGSVTEMPPTAATKNSEDAENLDARCDMRAGPATGWPGTGPGRACAAAPTSRPRPGRGGPAPRRAGADVPA